MSDDFTQVRHGIAPTDTVSPPYRDCEMCGQPALHGVTLAGQRLALDCGWPCYAVTWVNGAREPTFYESRSYPVHRCG